MKAAWLKQYERQISNMFEDLLLLPWTIFKTVVELVVRLSKERGIGPGVVDSILSGCRVHHRRDRDQNSPFGSQGL